MPGATSARRVVLNRRVLDEITLGFADGLFEWAKAALEATVVPVADEPIRRANGRIEEPGALRDSRGAAAWVDGKKVAELPRPDGKRVTLRGVSREHIVAVAGFGARHAHLVEGGTINSAPHPFFTQAVAETIPGAAPFISLGMAKHALLREAVKDYRVAKAAGDTIRTRRIGAAMGRVSRVGPQARRTRPSR